MQLLVGIRFCYRLPLHVKVVFILGLNFKNKVDFQRKKNYGCQSEVAEVAAKPTLLFAKEKDLVTTSVAILSTVCVQGYVLTADVAVFTQGIVNIASVSLQIGYPTVASVPHSIINGFKVCCFHSCVSVLAIYMGCHK